jgi:L-ascorbate metabolism protein UlaG (beta-lactamase superfamily)
MICSPPSVRYIGHSTVVIDMDKTRVVTDPLLRGRVAHLRRRAAAPRPAWVANADAILISHLHRDHLDIPSLRKLGRGRRLIVPQGAGTLLRWLGFRRIDELDAGEFIDIGDVRVTATPAVHSGFRPPIGPRGVPVGFVVAGSRRVYFAGDTDIFPQMADLAGHLDVALLPVWGWGSSLGPGHLNPERAAAALALLRPALAIPIHWGTFAAAGVRKRDLSFLVDPPHRFVDHAARLAPHSAVRILTPGECTSIAPLPASSRGAS